MRGALALTVFENSWSSELGAVFFVCSHPLPADEQQVLCPGLVFASNDAGQTRFAALKTPASKWGGGPAILQKSALIRVHLRRKAFAVAFAENWVPLELATWSCF